MTPVQLEKLLPAKKIVTATCVAVTAAGLLVVGTQSAVAGTQPSVQRLSATRGAYFGGKTITVYGTNFSKVRQVKFGSSTAWNYHVTSPTTLTVTTPWHGYGATYVRVVTATGTSVQAAGAKFTYTKPRMSDPIQGGLTGTQAQRISSTVRAKHKGVRTAKRSKRWTAAMGQTAMKRARSWLGLPYSWAGGNGSGPTKGVCAHNGGDLDCRIIGFDCSGLSLNAWWPYRKMAHLASRQRSQAGRYHPGVGELMPGDLVFFSGYISGGIGHVGIYEGKGWVIEAPESGSVVRRSRLADMIAHNGTYRGATRPTSTGRQGAAPVVTAVSKTLSTKGGALTVTGRNLGAATSVTVGTKTLYSFVSRSATKLVVAAPAARAGKATVRVSNAWGTVKRSVVVVAPAPVAPPKAPVTPPSVPVTVPVSPRAGHGTTAPVTSAPSSSAPTSQPPSSAPTAPSTPTSGTTSPAPSASPSSAPSSAGSTAGLSAPATAGGAPAPPR